MTIAINPSAPQKSLTFDEFLAHHGSDNRYELIDGKVFALEPTGLHEEVAAFITTKICVQIDETGLPWFILQRGLLRPSNMGMIAFRPDVAVVDRDELTQELLWSDQSILTLGSSIKFVAEVVSSNWQNDYALDTPTAEASGILGSTKPLKLDSLQFLAQRWDSPQALLSECPSVVAFLQVLFSLKQICFKSRSSSSCESFTCCQEEARTMQQNRIDSIVKVQRLAFRQLGF